MRRVLAIFFLSIYLIGTTEAYQLLKVPSLVIHYIQHNNQDPNTSIRSFLQLHYQDEITYDADWLQDMKLPFKTHEDDLSLLSHTYYPPVQVVTVIAPSKIVPIVHSPLRHQYVVDRQAADIFQPPKA